MGVTGTAYATAAQYRAVFGLNDAAHDAQIGQDLLAMSRYIERCLDRRTTGFNQDASASARVFWPRGYHQGDPEAENPWRGVRQSRIIDVDEFSVLPTSVLVDTNYQGTFTGYTALTNPTDAGGLLGGDYQCWPPNEQTGPEPQPWHTLYLPSWAKNLTGWPPGAMVQVTATWGWPAVPATIVDATIQLVGILRIESARATTRIPEEMGQTIQASKRGRDIVDSLKHSYKRERIYA